jgi:ABC-type multidrug transport system fused ATPase/permease subunit
MRGRTTFIIAHRFGTITHARRIVVVDGGTIASIGTHDELLSSSQVYRRLYQLQFRESE